MDCSDLFYIENMGDGVRRNPTSRQCVVRSSPSTERDIFRGIGNPTAVCGWFKSCLPNETSSGESGIPHHGSVWFVQVLSTERDIFRVCGNPNYGGEGLRQVLSSRRIII